MDILNFLPPEITEKVLEVLPGKDLWMCLSVNKHWRNQANSPRLWIPHCQDLDLDPAELVKSDEECSNEIELCLPAKEWSRCWKVINCWKHKSFTSFQLPGELYEPHFFCYKKKIAFLDRGLVIKIYNLLQDRLESSYQFTMPLCTSFFEYGNILMNNKYLIFVLDNIGLIYKAIDRDNWDLYSSFALNRNRIIDFEYEKQTEFIQTNHHFIDNSSCDFSVLIGDRFWASYRRQSKLETHLIVDLNTDSVKYITPPWKEQVLTVSRVKRRIMFQSISAIALYDSLGELLFNKRVGEYLCVTANDKFVVVFKAYTLKTYDIATGESLCDIPNSYFLPRVVIHPIHDAIYLAQIDGRCNCKVSSFSATTGNQIWTTKIPMGPHEYMGNKYKFIYGVYLIVCIEAVSGLRQRERERKKIYVIDVIKGTIIQEYKFQDLIFLSQDFYIRKKKPVTLFSE